MYRVLFPYIGKGSYMFFSSITADYTKMGYPKAIVRALDFLKNTDLKALPGGRHAIEGDMMYANVDDVETKLFETTKPESHRNYIDIQFMVDGEENMGFFVDKGLVKPVESYPDRDCYSTQTKLLMKDTFTVQKDIIQYSSHLISIDHY